MGILEQWKSDKKMCDKSDNHAYIFWNNAANYNYVN